MKATVVWLDEHDDGSRYDTFDQAREDFLDWYRRSEEGRKADPPISVRTAVGRD